MNTHKPRMSIGLPVFNGENYLAEALDSLLAQTYSDFELIISDNASTDKTEEICRAYAAKDQRIRYYRNEKNLGAAKNYNRVFELASGEYFKWAAHDDMCAPDFIEKCVAVLEQDPSIVVCHPRVKVINPDGSFRRYEQSELNTDSPKPQDRFHDLICIKHGCYQVFGVIRSNVLKKTPLIGSYAASDKVLLAELGLHGRFQELPEYLFWRRFHPQTSGNTNQGRRAWTIWFDPTKEGGIILPHWNIYIESFRSIRRAPLRRIERIYCYLYLIRRKGWLQGIWIRMFREILRALYDIIRFYIFDSKKIKRLLNITRKFRSTPT